MPAELMITDVKITMLVPGAAGSVVADLPLVCREGMVEEPLVGVGDAAAVLEAKVGVEVAGLVEVGRGVDIEIDDRGDNDVAELAPSSLLVPLSAATATLL